VGDKGCVGGVWGGGGGKRKLGGMLGLRLGGGAERSRAGGEELDVLCVWYHYHYHYHYQKRDSVELSSNATSFFLLRGLRMVQSGAKNFEGV